MQQAYAQEKKTKTTCCSEITIRCSEKLWPDQIKNGMSRALMARSEQKKIVRTEQQQVEQSITGRADQARLEQTRTENYRADKTWIEQSRTIEQSRKDRTYSLQRAIISLQGGFPKKK